MDLFTLVTPLQYPLTFKESMDRTAEFNKVDLLKGLARVQFNVLVACLKFTVIQHSASTPLHLQCFTLYSITFI